MHCYFIIFILLILPVYFSTDLTFELVYPNDTSIPEKTSSSFSVRPVQLQFTSNVTEAIVDETFTPTPTVAVTDQDVSYPSSLELIID